MAFGRAQCVARAFSLYALFCMQLAFLAASFNSDVGVARAGSISTK
jgi:hypothetical protein